MWTQFLNRPVLSLVISVFFVLLGLLSLLQLPVTQYPEIAPPAVSVTTRYTGANAEVCAKAVVTPLERAINGVPGMAYMNSVSSNDGTSIIQVYFKVGTDPDQAAVNVQNRVTTVLDELPEEVIKAGVSTEKEVNSMLLYLNLISADTSLDEKFIYNYADINVLAELKRIDGVGFADIMGQREYAMRVWLKPNMLDVYAISSQDVIQALRSQNVEAAPGKVGESSGRSAQSLQYVIKYAGKFTEKNQYENLVVKTADDGSLVRLRDVADIEFGSLDYDVLSKENGKPSAAIILKQRPGSNAREVIKNIKSKMEELKRTSFPAGMDYTLSYDVSRFLDASIREVLKTLLEAFLLVALVVFLFLQDWRSTLIPVLAVPVSLIGTFAFIQAFGFSINMLTLFALVLAIGIVVDNAIVVVEAVHANMEKKQLHPRAATFAAMKEIGGAIVAITLVMSAVFVPVSFLDGPVGVFYRQFSVTMATAIVISGVNALTLTPVLCMLLLRPGHGKNGRWLDRFFAAFNRRYDALTLRYAWIIRRWIPKRGLTVAVLGVFIVGLWWLSRLVSTGFIPTEDQGTLYINVTTPAGATLERTEAVMKEIDRVVLATEGVEGISSLTGYSMMTEGSGAAYGMGTVNLKPWSERTGNAVALASLLQSKLAHIRDADIQIFPPPAVPGYGNASGFELRLLDKTGSGDLQALNRISGRFMDTVRRHPAVKSLFSSFNPGFPQYLIHLDQDIAAKKHIRADEALDNLQSLLGSFYATNFIRYSQMYKVMVQADPAYRRQPDDILKLKVKNARGEMVPYSMFCRLERIYGPEQLTRYNMYLAAMLNGEPSEGFSTGDAIEAVENLASTVLPRGYTIEWSGMTREEIESGNQVMWIFLLCFVFVYLILAAQYESFRLPFPVLLSIPLGIAGSFLLLWLLGLENNIYAQVAMVMLIGLLGKNAILIVEFAVLREKKGDTPEQAVRLAAVDRLRPILMTSFAFIAGLLPLMLAGGAGAIGNRTIGTAAAGGMLSGTIAGVLFIPGLYYLFRKASGKKALLTILLPMGLMSVGQLQAQDISTNPVSTTNDSMVLELRKRIFTDGLSSVIDSTFTRHYDWLMNREEINMASARVLAARAALIPGLQLTGSSGLRRFGDYTMDGVGNYDTRFSPNLNERQQIPNPLPDFFGAVGMSWEVDVWGKLRAGKKAALARYLAGTESRRWMQTRIVREVAGSYLHMAWLQGEYKVWQENLRLQQQSLEITTLQKEAGRANSLAVNAFAAQVLDISGELERVQQEQRETEYALLFSLGLPQTTFPYSKPEPLGLPDTILFNGLWEKASDSWLEQRPDVAAARQSLEAAGADVILARKAFYPSLNISTFAGLQSFNALLLADPASLAYNVMAGVSAPVVNRRALRAGRIAAEAEERKALLEYRKTLANAALEVRTALTRMETDLERYRIKTREVALLQRNTADALELFAAGKAGYLEVINTQQLVLKNALQLNELAYRLRLHRLDLYAALGGGW
ncbi:MAG: efflux RND transporter permease subunit [Bacteroidia bacterium]